MAIVLSSLYINDSADFSVQCWCDNFVSFTKNIGYCAFCYVLYLNSKIFWAKHVSLWLDWAKRKAEQSEDVEKYIGWPSILIFLLISGVLRALIVKGKSVFPQSWLWLCAVRSWVKFLPNFKPSVVSHYSIPPQSSAA